MPEPFLTVDASGLTDAELDVVAKLAEFLSMRPDVSSGASAFWASLSDGAGRLRALREVLWLEHSERILPGPLDWDAAVTRLGLEDTP